MDAVQENILRLLGKRGPLSYTQLCRQLCCHRAKAKNDATEKLMHAGLVKQELIKLNPDAKKPDSFMSLTRFGQDFLIKVGKDKSTY